MQNVSGLIVPKMNPTSHAGNIRLLRPVVVTVEHQEDSQAEHEETYGEEKPEDILHIVTEGMSQGLVIDIMTFNSYSLQNYSCWKGTRIIGSSDCFR